MRQPLYPSTLRQSSQTDLSTAQVQLPSKPSLIVPGQIPADASGALIDGDIKAHTVSQFLFSIDARNNVWQI